MTGTRQTGRLDRLGPAASGVRGVAAAARSGASAVSHGVRRAMREPVAVRDARRAQLTALARSAAAGPAAVGPDATAALDAAVTAWLADPGPVTGALLRAAQGHHRATGPWPADTRAGALPPALAGMPLDEAQRLTDLLATARATRSAPAGRTRG